MDFLADSHSHSLCSSDGWSTMLEMAEGALRAGLTVLTITDHIDLDYYATGDHDAYCFEKWPDMLEDFCEACISLGDKLTLLLGIELGAVNHHPERAHEIAATPGLDFIIGSVHNLRGMPDFYGLKYENREHCLKLLETYLEENRELARCPDIDVIGHIGYTRRYMRQAGFDIGLDDHTDILREVFKDAIAHGRGIELNASGYRQGLEDGIPNERFIKLYRECGGEIITVGSDAHLPEHVGNDIERGYEALRRSGFKYVTVFKSRKPQFIKL